MIMSLSAPVAADVMGGPAKCSSPEFLCTLYSIKIKGVCWTKLCSNDTARIGAHNKLKQIQGSCTQPLHV